MSPLACSLHTSVKMRKHVLTTSRLFPLTALLPQVLKLPVPSRLTPFSSLQVLRFPALQPPSAEIEGHLWRSPLAVAGTQPGSDRDFHHCHGMMTE